MKIKRLLLPAALAAALLAMGAAAVNKTGVFYDLNLGATTNKISDDGAQITYNGNPVVSTTFVTNHYTFTTNIFENSYVLYTNTFLEYYITTNTYNSVTNYFTDVFNWSTNTYYSFYSYTNIYNGGKITYNNSTIIYTNTSVTFNGTNIATINPTDGFIPVRVGTNYFGDSGLSSTNGRTYTEKNIGAILDAGAASYVDLIYATRTNTVSGAVAITHATNGVMRVGFTYERDFWNFSGSDQTFSIPSTWKTNKLTVGVPVALTNGTITVMFLRCVGDTSSAANQTNVLVSGWEYY